jgi:gamma-glutamylcyclotransferase (GGCT)/AIG2-like uncharacterized protein YtfP
MGFIKGFTMYSLGAYPALVKNDSGMECVVELYDVPCMNRLDKLEGYPSYYTRKRMRVQTPEGNVLAWVYYMNRDLSSNPMVSSGDWKQYLKDAKNRSSK